MSSRTCSAVSALGVGVAAAVAGLLPWLITGMRLQHGQPVMLLPLDRYYLNAVFGILAMPGGIVGVVLRHQLHSGWRRRSFGPVLCGVFGVLVVQVVACVQAMMVLIPSLRAGGSPPHLIAIGSTLVIAVLVGMGIALAIARSSRGAATIAAVGAALGIGSWISAFQSLNPDAASRLPQLAELTGVLATAVPAAVTGIALAWCGWRPVRRLGAWIGALVILWAGGAILNGLFAAASSRADSSDFAAMTTQGLHSLSASLLSGWIALLAALAVGVIGSSVRSVARD